MSAGTERSVRTNGATGDLLRDSQVTVRSGSPGHYDGAVTEHWKTFTAFGGMMLTVALRAASCAVDRPTFAPVHVSASFCRPLECGPVRIATEVVCRTASMAQVTASLCAADDPRPYLCALASFGSPVKTAARLENLAFPSDVLGPDDALRSDAQLLGFPLLEQSVTRWAHEFWNRPGRHGAGQHSASEPAEVASWIRYHEPPLRADGTWDPVTYPAPADTMSPALFRGLGPRTAALETVTLAMDLHVFATTRREWILQRSRIARVSDGYACGTVELWDEDRTLLALSTQRRLCRPLRRRSAPERTDTAR
jgi:acyl-CoA thioesterase